MITRGHLIGEIVDGLTTINMQVATRCRLGLTDLNRYLEDFFKEFLNIAYSYNLKNLNEERSNEPGLDLGDVAASIGFQITSTKTTQKIDKTLTAVAGRKDSFSQIRVLIIGNKQKEYSFDPIIAGRLNFTKKDIWDIDDLCMQAISLPLKELNALYELLKSNLSRISIELEIPDMDGNYATSIDNYLEKIPKQRMSDFKKYNKFQSDSYLSIHKCDYHNSPADDKKNFESLVSKLVKLPRITRELYAVLLERRETNEKKIPASQGECLWIDKNILDRICTLPSLEDDLRLLDHADLAEIYEGFPGDPLLIRIRGLKSEDAFNHDFVRFIDSNNIGYRNPIVSLDFSRF